MKMETSHDTQHNREPATNKPILVEPAVAYREQFLTMMREWEATGEKVEPFTLRMNADDFVSYIDMLQDMKTASTEGVKAVNSSTYWLLSADEQHMLGAVTIRHELNEHFLRIGGHISFGIRPTARGQGLGSMLLAMALQHANELGVERALLTCEREHEVACWIIEKHGGELENEVFFGGKMFRRYWVKVL